MNDYEKIRCYWRDYCTREAAGDRLAHALDEHVERERPQHEVVHEDDALALPPEAGRLGEGHQHGDEREVATGDEQRVVRVHQRPALALAGQGEEVRGGKGTEQGKCGRTRKRHDECETKYR